MYKKHSQKNTENLRANPPLLMTVAEAAIVSSLGKTTIRRACRSKRLRSIRVGTRKLVIRYEDLLKWIESYAEEGGEV
jgi:excisionase family DNA binding protein